MIFLHADIGKTLSMIGIGGWRSFEGAFTRYSPEIQSSIWKVTDGVVKESFLNKIVLFPMSV